jgi:NAD+ diphosphatase
MQHDPVFQLEPSAATGFAVNRLDRMAERRDETDFIAALAAQNSARCLVFTGETALFKQRDGAFDPLFAFAETATLGNERELAFLGRLAEGEAARSIFARLVEMELSEPALSQAGLAAVDMRTVATRGLVAAEYIGALGQAKSLLNWHARHRFCANCGAPTEPVAAGWRRDCANCRTQHFPRTDPVVIMLVTHGETCLLGRQPRFPPGMYSCLAGFVEGGETLEAAVRREILEEAGIRVGRVAYYASQPWPFPSSLMIGCIAEAISADLVVDQKELEDARWFSRDEIGQMFSKTHPAGFSCPPKLAIANLLVWSWAKGEIP